MANYVDGFVVRFRSTTSTPTGGWHAGGQDLEGARRAGIQGMRRRRREAGKVTSFPQSVKLKPGETVVFSWIVFKSRAQRDRINAKVMKDPRLADMMRREGHALRRQADDLRRLQGHRRRLSGTPGAAALRRAGRGLRVRDHARPVEQAGGPIGAQVELDRARLEVCLAALVVGGESLRTLARGRVAAALGRGSRASSSGCRRG